MKAVFPLNNTLPQIGGIHDFLNKKPLEGNIRDTGLQYCLTATSRSKVLDGFVPSPQIIAYRKELYGAQQIGVIFPQKTNICLKAKQKVPFLR